MAAMILRVIFKVDIWNASKVVTYVEMDISSMAF